VKVTTDYGVPLLTLRGHAAPLTSLAVSPDGRLLVSADRDGVVKVWDRGNAAEALTVQAPAGVLWRQVSVSPDDKRLALVARPVNQPPNRVEEVRLRDLATGQETVLTRAADQSLTYVGFSPDGRRLLTVSSRPNPLVVKLWDVESGRELWTLPDVKVLSALAFSADGGRLATAGPSEPIRVWDTASGKEVLTLATRLEHVWTITFSPDGTQLAATGQVDADRRTAWGIQTWDAVTGAPETTLTGQERKVVGLAYSPDGKQLASASLDGTIKVWDLGAGREITTLRGHAGPVLRVAYSHDGRRLASASRDGTVKIWEVHTGREVLTLHGHDGPVIAVSFGPDSKLLRSVGENGTVKIWDGTPVEK
jgi:WD40 repeat protein